MANQTGKSAAGSINAVSQGAAAPRKSTTLAHVAPRGSIEAIPDITLWAGLVLLAALFIGGVCWYFYRLKKLSSEYASLSARIDGHFGGRSETGLSPGHTYTIASRGPNHAREAELQSARARWRHFSMAFPHMDDRGEKRPLVLISRPYIVSQPIVQIVQDLIHARAISFLARDGRRHIEPVWIKVLGADFDALRHPELAISNPAIYAFPFFLTWQRRHQWGVLPYGVHNRLGVICHKDHPKARELSACEAKYTAGIDRARREQTALWVNDPGYADWLPILLDTANKAREEGALAPLIIDRRPAAPSIADQHVTPTVFSVGAYLHKEILPLTCAVLPDACAGASYANSACELEVTDVFPPSKKPVAEVGAGTEGHSFGAVDVQFPAPGMLLADPKKWRKESAVIIDLAVIPESFNKTDWLVLRLPHCVYVPIGIGYSVATVPLLLADPGWWNRLLADVGDSLMPISEALGDLGIELDPRLWNSEIREGD